METLVNTLILFSQGYKPEQVIRIDHQSTVFSAGSISCSFDKLERHIICYAKQIMNTLMEEKDGVFYINKAALTDKEYKELKRVIKFPCIFVYYHPYMGSKALYDCRINKNNVKLNLEKRFCAPCKFNFNFH